jgi:hypothetical protein
MIRIVNRYYLVPLLLLLALWSGWFIHQTSFVLAGERYYSLFDDAMISMTYAKNVTQGFGLNWAKFGDPVEGYTSPLWTFCMVPFQLLPIAWGKVSLAFAIFCAMVLGTNVVVLDKILRKRFSIEALLPRMAATFSLAFLYPLNFWSLEGMECGPQVLLFLLGLDQFMAFEQGRNPKHLYRLGVVLAAAMLLRMDMIFFVGWVILFLAPWLWANKQMAWRFLLIAGAPMALYLGFRLLYFHDLFPNTYYLKLYKIPLNVRLLRGWHYFEIWAKPLWMVWYMLPLMVALCWRNRGAWLSFACIITYFAYNIYVGGDAWEPEDIGANRFTIVVMPFAIILLVTGWSTLAARLRGIAGTILKNLLPAASAILLMILVNGILFVKGKEHNWDRLWVVKPPYNTDYQTWNTSKALQMNDWLGTGNRVACVQAGDIGYFCHAELVDMMGYNGHKIAREETYFKLTPEFYMLFLPGHMKVDYDWVMRDMKPDHIVDFWSVAPELRLHFDSMLVELHYVEAPIGGWNKEGYQRREK